MMKPPYTVITAYDLNKGAIRWQTGFGDDPTLAAQGIHGTGMPQMRNSVIVTASGLLFGFGGDSTIYAYDTDTGKVLWSAPLGGASGVRGSPVMYEIDGRAYLLVPIGNASGANNCRATSRRTSGLRNVRSAGKVNFKVGEFSDAEQNTKVDELSFFYWSARPASPPPVNSRRSTEQDDLRGRLQGR